MNIIQERLEIMLEESEFELINNTNIKSFQWDKDLNFSFAVYISLIYYIIAFLKCI